MPIGKNKTRLTATVEVGIAQSVEDLADKENRTVSAMLAILIKEALDNRNKTQHGFIRGAEYYKCVTESAEDETENSV